MDEKENAEISFPKQNASCELINCEDEVTVAARNAFHITYLFPWQRIVISNILEAAAFADRKKQEELPEDRLNWKELEKFLHTEKNSLGDEQDYSGSELNQITEYYDESISGYIKTDDDEAGEDVFCRGRQIVLLPTGAGKSLCFLTPALLLNGPTLILYPLIALMSDQKRRMDEGGLSSVVFRGGQTEEEREENFRQIKEGAKIILANPEVLQNKKLLVRLSKCGIKHIAIDEVHVASEWGDTFRPAYLTLGEIIKTLDVPVVTAFTATASPHVMSRISEILFNGEAHIVRSDSDRPNIHYYVQNAYAKKRAAFKLAIREQKPLIVFCSTRNRAEEMARELSFYYGEDRVKFYHAGLNKEEKNYVEKWFYPKTDAILCSTCAFGMGVDKKDIHCVIHLDVPSTAEAYIQEAGRGGRDGSIAKGILLWSYNDSHERSLYAENSREKVMKDFAEAETCRRQILLDALGGEQAPCDGCDVCERHGPSPFAEDAQRVLDFIRRHKRLYTETEIYEPLAELLNSHDLNEFKINIWEHNDVSEILQQLHSEGYIRICLWPWKDKITCGFAGKKISRIYTSRFWKKLVSIQKKIILLQKAFLKLLHRPGNFLLLLVRKLQQFF